MSFCKAHPDAELEGHPASVESALSRDPELFEHGLDQDLTGEPDETVSPAGSPANPSCRFDPAPKEWAAIALAPYQTMALATMTTATPTINLSMISEDLGTGSLVGEHLDTQEIMHNAAPKEVRRLGEVPANHSTSCESLVSRYLDDGEFQVYESQSYVELGSSEDELVSQNLPCEPQLDPHQLIRNIDTGECSRCEPVVDSSPSKPLDSQERPQLWAQWWADKRLKDEHLWAAAETGNLEDLQEALATPSDGGPQAAINSQALYGRRALHLAASGGNTDCAELLLDAGAEIEARTDAGLTALHVACQRGHLDLTLLLLDRGARMLAETCDCNLPIHLAAAKGHSDIVALLLERSGGKLLRTAVRELLLMKNSLGQRPSEVSLDRKTADLFWQLESEMSDRNNQVIDHYAGRAPSSMGGDVLRRNARADMVHRLLQKTGHSPNAQRDSAAVESSKEDNLDSSAERSSKLLASQSGGQVRGPFARIRADSAEVEEVGPDSFGFIQKLGSGSYGEVYQVKHKKTNLVYAMKIINKSKIQSGKLLRCTMSERNVLSYMHHPYVVALHYAFQTPQYFVLVMQYYPGGNLQDLIDKDRKLTEDVARLYTAEMLLAVSHLHDRHIVYRDLKPANVVIDEFGHSALTDFGLSKEGVSQLRGTQSFCGSSAYMAPEILQRRGQGHTVDIYGLGVLLFNMLCGVPPFWHPDKKVLTRNIIQARLHTPDFVTEPAASLIKALMKREPSKRLGANRTLDVQEHEFFADIDFDGMMNREACVPAQAETSGAPTAWPSKEKSLFNWNNGKKSKCFS